MKLGSNHVKFYSIGPQETSITVVSCQLAPTDWGNRKKTETDYLLALHSLHLRGKTRKEDGH